MRRLRPPRGCRHDHHDRKRQKLRAPRMPGMRAEAAARRRLRRADGDPQQVRKSGRMGCATCYQAFDTLVQPLMVRMNGIPQQHAADETGHAPESPANEKQARINKLREEMFAAVNAEEYERAAQLRDQIRLLEQEGGENGE